MDIFIPNVAVPEKKTWPRIKHTEKPENIAVSHLAFNTAGKIYCRFSQTGSHRVIGPAYFKTGMPIGICHAEEDRCQHLKAMTPFKIEVYTDYKSHITGSIFKMCGSNMMIILHPGKKSQIGGQKIKSQGIVSHWGTRYD
jgi:hypothetical protein